jgi:hypothetical protein
MIGPTELFALLVLVIPTVAFWKICEKAGFSRWLGLLMLIPFVNLLFMLIVAFRDWPIERR